MSDKPASRHSKPLSSKKRKFLQSKGEHKKKGIRPGMKGVLITCVRGKERFSVLEASALCNEYAEAMIEEQKANGTYRDPTNDDNEEDDDEDNEAEEENEGEGEEDDNGEDGRPRKKLKKAVPAAVEDSDSDEGGDGSGEVDFRAAFEKEMTQLKEKDPAKKLVSNVFLDMACVIFIRVHASIDPAELVKRIFVDVERTKIARTRHCSRFTPVEAVCHASPEGLEKLKEPIFDKYFHQPKQPSHTFCVQFNTRNHVGGLERESTMRKMASMVGSHHIIDLKTAELTIIVEVMKNVACVGVLPEFKRFMKYNIVSVLGIRTSSNKQLIEKLEKAKVKAAGQEGPPVSTEPEDAKEAEEKPKEESTVNQPTNPEQQQEEEGQQPQEDALAQ